MAAWGQPEAPVGEAAPPETLEELEELRLTIIEEMNGIRNQLSGRKADIEQEAAASGSFDRYGKPMAQRPHGGTLMGPCDCGHSVEEHEDGPCSGEVTWNGKTEPCRCVAYEEADQDP